MDEARRKLPILLGHSNPCDIPDASLDFVMLPYSLGIRKEEVCGWLHPTFEEKPMVIGYTDADTLEEVIRYGIGGAYDAIINMDMLINSSSFEVIMNGFDKI